MANHHTILVIDDDPTAGEVLRDLLSPPRWDVLQVASGLAGLDLLTERLRLHQAVDLVLLDVRMPQFGGLQTLIQIRQLRPPVRVAPFTAAHDPQIGELFTELGYPSTSLKHLPTTHWETTIAHWLTLPPPPPLTSALYDLLGTYVATEEQQVRAASGDALCLYVLDVTRRLGLLRAFEHSSRPMLVADTVEAALAILSQPTTKLLVTTADAYDAALHLHALTQKPILLITTTLREALLGLDAVVAGVVLVRTPGDAFTLLPQAVETVLAGQSFRSIALERMFKGLLTNREALVAILTLQQWPTERIAAHLGVDTNTIYRYRTAIYTRVGARDVASLWAWVEQHLSLPQS
jgi:DNA-binding NarL/FixJ family response regulator